jgi:uncharacterized protein
MLGGARSDTLAEPAGWWPVRQLPLATLVALALAPGAAGTLVYAAVAGPVQAAGYPALAALLVAIAIVILPLELALLWIARSRARAAGEPLIPYRSPMPVRSWAWLVPALLLAAVVGSAILMLADGLVARVLFSWLPAWYLQPIDINLVSHYSAVAWVATLAAYMVLNGFAGPVVEELYFRGWLLPRMARFGRWAPLLNVTLFSLYHFWAPWQFLSRIAAVAPFAYAVWWRRNVYLGMAVHILLNVVGGGLVVASIASRL